MQKRIRKHAKAPIDIKKNRVVIIGGGIAATACAQELLRLNDPMKIDVVMVSASPILKEVIELTLD